MVTLALVVLMGQVISGDRSVVSKCEVSADAEYGHTKEKPIKVGGTPMYGPARQRRYLQALVGPAGQSVTFRRRGSLAPNADGIILDLYEVSYAGLDKPIELYLDLYRWDSPKAPQGFVCAQEIDLAPPPAPPGVPSRPPAPPPGPPPGGLPRPLPWDRIVQLAIETGQREELPPIPLDPYGSLRYGVAFDPFTRIARLARAAGGNVSRDTLAGIRSVETLVIAFPMDCGGSTAKPIDINMTYNGRTMSRMVQMLKGDALERQLPAYEAPDGAIGVIMIGSTLVAGQLTITYDRPPCAGQASSVTLTMQSTRGQGHRVQPVWPAGVPVPAEGSVRVTLHALIDHEGVPSEIKVVDGPEPFHAAAIESVKASRYGANVVNGVAMRLPRPFATTIVFMPPRQNSALELR